MKTELRKVTVEQEVYVACDGKEFLDAYDCERYEYDLIEKKLHCYDSKCRPCDFDACTYVKIITREDYENLVSCCSYLGITRKGLTESDGVFMYDDKGWINITEVISNIYGGTYENEKT